MEAESGTGTILTRWGVLDYGSAMPRTARVAPGGMVFHVLNRGVARMQLFEKAADYQAFGDGKRVRKRDRYDIDKMGSFGLWFGDATYSAGRSWWNGFSRFKSRRGANAVVRESGRLPSIRAGFAGYS